MEIVKRPLEKDNFDVENFWKQNDFEVCLKRVRMFMHVNKNGEHEYIEEKTLDEKNELSENVSKDTNHSASFVNDEFTVRLCTLKEKEGVAQLLNECFSVYTGCLPSDEELKLDLENGLVIGAFDTVEKLIGVLHFWKKKGISEIRHLAVSKDYRNKGIGISLIEFVFKIPNMKNITLEVCVDNYAAICLYKKMGFTIATIRKKYYKSKDGYLMIREMM